MTSAKRNVLANRRVMMRMVKAWPLKFFEGETVINDEIAGQSLVLIDNAETRTVRAYERGAHGFSLAGHLVNSADGTLWQLSEDATTSGDRQV